MDACKTISDELGLSAGELEKLALTDQDLAKVTGGVGNLIGETAQRTIIIRPPLEPTCSSPLIT